MVMKVTLQNTIGAALLGLVAASILFGITVLQIYIYYLNYPKDWRFQKVSVAILLFLDSLHLALTVHAVYHYVIDEFGDLNGQQFVVWSFKLQITINVAIVMLVQGLYALRVWKLGRNFSRIWPWLVIAIVLGGYVIGIFLAVETYGITTFNDLHKMSWVVYASFSSSTVIDIALATAICYYLHASRSSFFGTNNRIITIMRYVLISGFLTSACSLSALITYAIMPNNLVFLGIEFLLTKLYINSYIAMLNARNTVRDQESSSFSVSKILNLRTGTANLTETTNDGLADDKADRDAIHLTSTSYRARLEEEFDPDSKLQADLRSPSHLGVTVHRTQQRHYEDLRHPV